MPRLAYLNYTGNQRLRTTSQFGGLNKNLVSSDNEFSDMKNISDRFYPAIATREPRGEITRTIENANAFFWKNGLFYVSGTDAYYKDKKVGEVTDGEKQLCGIGAYIVIWPDKKVYNTSSGEWLGIEKTYESSGEVTIEPLTVGSAFTKLNLTGIGSTFAQYDAVEISGVTQEDLNKTTVIQQIGDGYIVITGVVDEEFTQTDTITVKRTAPDMDYICECNNRVWGCSSENHEIYACKLGDPQNWNAFESISTDSYAVTVGSNGDFTGCIGHLGYTLFFKENTIHKMYGSKPSAFQLNTYDLPGVRKGCSKSMEIVNETLYYVGRNAVYCFDGSTPNTISEKLGDLRFTEGCASQQDSKYYLSANDGKETRLYVYDPQTQLWDIEDGTGFKYAFYAEGTLTYLNESGEMRTITGSGTENIPWYLESGDIIEQSITNKYISKLLFNFWLERRTIVKVYIKWDDSPIWEHKGSIKSEFNNTYTLPIIPRRCNKFRYRLEGCGQFKLIGLGRYDEDGSEVQIGIVRH